METIILAGGLGARLRSVVSDVPKPMAPIRERPFLEYLIRYLRKNGIKDIILSIGYKANIIQEYFGDGSQFGVTIRYTFEPEPLGTGGAVKLAHKLIDADDYLVMNGDTFLKIDFEDLIKQHRMNKAVGSIALYQHQNVGRYGSVNIGSDNRILGFNEKGGNQGGLINGGIYIFSKHLIEPYFIENKFSLERDVFPKMIGDNFFGFSYNNYFIDIGVPEDYYRAQLELSEGF